MKEKITVGIVGMGFVGSAVAHGFKNQNLVLIDPLLGTSIEDLLDKDPDVVFICVPTPMGADGKINASIVESVIANIKDINTIIVLKSTVTPDIVERLSHSSHYFVYNPEFLREETALYDFEHPTHHVFGGNIDVTKILEYIYSQYSICTGFAKVYHVTAAEASFVKYGINCYLASKVLFWNQFAKQCEKLGVDYNNVQNAISGDPRIGSSHTNVPGSDGKLGFAGACFPKDSSAFSELFPEFTVLKETIRANNKIRSQYELSDREKAQNITYNQKI